MSIVDFSRLLRELRGVRVERPNRQGRGTLSGHAAGEPFEKCAYQLLRNLYPDRIYKQHEFLNDLYLKNPQHITVSDRAALLDSPVALFLLSRGAQATRAWTPEHIFEEKQNDTADMLYYEPGYYGIIDVKTRNINKNAQAPNIISAYKLAKVCALMLDNQEYEGISLDYIGVDWQEQGDTLEAVATHHACLFKAKPEVLYINWAAAMQIQFHIESLDQSWQGTCEEWARGYLRCFVASAESRCQKMRADYIEPFLPYLR